MKRFSRMAAGIAAVMLGVGILLCILGAAKVDRDALEKAYGFDGEFGRVSGKAANIYMEIPYGYIHIGTTDGDEVVFGAINIKEGSVTAEFRNGSFYASAEYRAEGLDIFGIQIPYQISIGNKGGGNSVPAYTLLLPNGHYGMVDISLDCGKIEVEGLSTDQLNLEVKAGEILVTETFARDAEIECAMGQVDAAGDFIRLEGDVDMGTFCLQLSGSEEEYSCEVSCGVGAIEYGRREWGGFSRDYESYGSAGKSIELSCGMGSIQVGFGTYGNTKN